MMLSRQWPKMSRIPREEPAANEEFERIKRETQEIVGMDATYVRGLRKRNRKKAKALALFLLDRPLTSSPDDSCISSCIIE